MRVVKREIDSDSCVQVMVEIGEEWRRDGRHEDEVGRPVRLIRHPKRHATDILSLVQCLNLFFEWSITASILIQFLQDVFQYKLDTLTFPMVIFSVNNSRYWQFNCQHKTDLVFELVVTSMSQKSSIKCDGCLTSDWLKS